MPKGKPWSRDELFIAMNLYCKIPFSQFNHTNKTIIKVAQKLGRTPSSLSMKLCNLASFDPSHKSRGVKGLQGASRRDEEVWNVFHLDWRLAGEESERLLAKLMGEEMDGSPGIFEPDPPAGPTEKETTIISRIGQNFFRRMVLASYDNQCCISGNPVPEMLVASHIAPWSKYPNDRLNPQNGLCLSCIHDAAFDRGLISFDENYRLIVSKYLEDYLPNEAIEMNFTRFEGSQMKLPHRFAPHEKFFRVHRAEIFRD